MADQLVTTAQVKAQNGIPDAVDDAVISSLIDGVSAWIEGYTNRKFIAEPAATYRFDTMAGYVLRIPRGIRAITTLKVATTHQPDVGGTFTTVTSVDYLLRPKAEGNSEGWPFFEVWLSRGTLAGTISRFGTYQNGAEITGDFGFATVPLDIQAVAIDATIAAYQARSDGASSVIGADAIAIEPWRSFFGAGSPQLKILNSYRYWRLA